jgi:hypothetical protein
MNYQERLRAQLVKHKFRVLGSFDGPKPHLLAPDKLALNILPPYRERFWQEFERNAGREGATLTLAPDFANLGSSQALCFNLFYPLVVDPAWAASFPQILGLKDRKPTSLAFEYSSERCDFVMRLDDGLRLAFDTRLAELTFGSPRERPGSLLYLLFPRANISLAQRQPTGEHVRVLYLEELCEKLKPALRGKDELLKAHYRELTQKYLLQD